MISANTRNTIHPFIFCILLSVPILVFPFDSTTVHYGIKADGGFTHTTYLMQDSAVHQYDKLHAFGWQKLDLVLSVKACSVHTILRALQPSYSVPFQSFFDVFLYGKIYDEKGNVGLGLEAGYLGPQTLGLGLTYKDFRVEGVKATSFYVNKARLNLSYWGYGADVASDVGAITLSDYSGDKGFLYFIEHGKQSKNYHCTGLWFRMPFKPFSLFTEASLIPSQDAAVSGSVTWGAMIGGDLQYKLWRIDTLNIEAAARYYSTDFFAYYLEHPDRPIDLFPDVWDKSLDNWENYRLLKEQQIGLHAKGHLRLHLYKKLSFWAEHEILYIHMGERSWKLFPLLQDYLVFQPIKQMSLKIGVSTKMIGAILLQERKAIVSGNKAPRITNEITGLGPISDKQQSPFIEGRNFLMLLAKVDWNI